MITIVTEITVRYNDYLGISVTHADLKCGSFPQCDVNWQAHGLPSSGFVHRHCKWQHGYCQAQCQATRLMNKVQVADDSQKTPKAQQGGPQDGRTQEQGVCMGKLHYELQKVHVAVL